MKRFIAVLLLVVMTFSLSGCTFDPLSLFGLNTNAYENQGKVKEDKSKKDKAKEDKGKENNNKQKNSNKKQNQ